jgi:hypothetical protein
MGNQNNHNKILDNEPTQENTGNSLIQENETKKPTRDAKGRWLPGVSGNPNGAPLSLVGILKRKLLEIPEGERKEKADSLIDVYLDKAFGGSENLLKDILDRIDGKPKESIEHSGEIVQDVNLDEQTQQTLNEFLEWRKRQI